MNTGWVYLSHTIKSISQSFNTEIWTLSIIGHVFYNLKMVFETLIISAGTASNASKSAD